MRDETLWVRIRAPFAAFRWLQAGVYRATSPIIPPSAAWGLLLNLAGIDTRSPEVGITTATRNDAPTLLLALGAVTSSDTAVLYQQLHTYPVGNSGKELALRTHGQKYWILPTNREVLVGLDCVIGVRGEAEVLQRMRRGVDGELDVPRYGLPFAGDNNFFLERIDLLSSPPLCRWYSPLHPGDPPRSGSARLTIAIDRADASRTRTGLFAPSADALDRPPDDAWTCVPQVRAKALA